MAKLFNVLSQSQSTDINPAGTGFHTVWHITYKVMDGPAKGEVAMVTVPDTEHTEEDVDKAIRDKIKTLAAVASLGDG